MSVRLVLAEDNLLVREGVASLLTASGEIDVVAACAGPDELLAAVDEHRPDVVLTDIRMPPTHTDEGIRLARRLRQDAPDLGVVVLSQYVEPAFAVDLLADGTRGRGYVLKDHVDDTDRLVMVINTVAAGGSYIDDDVVDALVRGRARSRDSPLATLSPRETEVLAGLATGKSNAALARDLGISAHTVEKHTSLIFAKLGIAEDAEVNRRVRAVVLYLAGRASPPVDPA